jgi:hypothetical protein
MQDFSFKKFVEQDIFGFGEKLPLEKQEDDLPIRSFSVHRVIERLNQHQLSLGKSKSKFLSEIQWGDQPGAIKVQFTPRLNVKIQKFHHELFLDVLPVCLFYLRLQLVYDLFLETF